MTLNLCYASLVNRPKDAAVSEQCQDTASAEVVLFICLSQRLLRPVLATCPGRPSLLLLSDRRYEVFFTQPSTFNLALHGYAPLRVYAYTG